LGKEMERGTGRDNSVMGATEGGLSSLSFSIPILTDIQELYLIVYFVQTIRGHKSANEIGKKKRAKKQKVSSSIESSSHLIAQAINDGNQLELWKFLYEKGPPEGRLQAVAELLKFSRKPAPPIDSETEYDSDDQSSNGDEPPRRTSSSTSSSMNSSLSTENGYTSRHGSHSSHQVNSNARKTTYRDGSRSHVQQSFRSASSAFQHLEPNLSQSSHSSSSHSHGFNRGGQSQDHQSSSSSFSNIQRLQPNPSQSSHSISSSSQDSSSGGQSQEQSSSSRYGTSQQRQDANAGQSPHPFSSSAQDSSRGGQSQEQSSGTGFG
jgi:hypothetical protein